MHLLYCTDVSNRLGKSAERLLTTVSELKSELAEVRTSKDRTLESFRDLENSSRLKEQRCCELEESCTGLQNEKEKLLMMAAELKSELKEVRTSKDHALKSLNNEENSSRVAQQQCQELEATCTGLQSAKDELLQQIDQLQSELGMQRTLFRPATI